MKKRTRLFGFTLIELMIVVAIIGILSAIAIPNFQKYQARSRQSEARMALSAMYTAEKSYFAEWTAYTVCLNNAGFKPEGRKRYYTVGTVDTTPTSSNVGEPTCTVGEGGNGWSALVGAAGVITVLADMGALTVDPGSFVLYAIGNIATSTALNDTWTIDDTKDLTNVTNEVLSM